jgi:hypothetical protein
METASLKQVFDDLSEQYLAIHDTQQSQYYVW